MTAYFTPKNNQPWYVVETYRCTCFEILLLLLIYWSHLLLLKTLLHMFSITVNKWHLQKPACSFIACLLLSMHLQYWVTKSCITTQEIRLLHTWWPATSSCHMLNFKYFENPMQDWGNQHFVSQADIQLYSIVLIFPIVFVLKALIMTCM